MVINRTPAGSEWMHAPGAMPDAVRAARAVHRLFIASLRPGGGSYEFFAPDKGGDANSTEQQYFYDGSCTQLARDVVRVWTSTGPTSESLNETFGWQGGVSSGGTRIVNADGSVTWTATHAGSSFKGPIGSLSLAQGSANTACPISTPMFTLSGGTATGAYSIPTSATFKSGVLIGLTVTNAVLANGNTLNVTTNAGVSPTSPSLISGTIATAGTQIASFTANGFGDGTRTVISSGTQYTITDWHIVR